jgi:hypothetical protein
MGFGAAQPPPRNLAAAGIRWWQVGAGAEARFLWGATYPAAFSPDGKFLVTGAMRGGDVSVWDTSAVADQPGPSAGLAIAIVDRANLPDTLEN